MPWVLSNTHREQAEYEYKYVVFFRKRYSTKNWCNALFFWEASGRFFVLLIQ